MVYEEDGPVENRDPVYLAGEARRLIDDPMYIMAVKSMKEDIFRQFSELPLTPEHDDNRRALGAQLKAIENLGIYFDFVIRRGKEVQAKRNATENGTRKVV